MKVILINGIAPTRLRYSLGSFIHDRVKCLHNKGIHFEIFMLESDYSTFVRIIYKLLKSRDLPDQELIKWDIEENQYIIHHKYGIITTIASQRFPKKIIKNIMSKFEDEISIDSDSIIHAHWVYPHGYIATLLAKKYGVPCVITAHGSDIHTNPRCNRVFKEYSLKALNSADKVIFVSHTLLDSAKELGYSGENAVVIPNGIDRKYFCKMEKEEALKRTGWKQTKRYVVGFVGNLIPVKRADKFVEIFSEIQKKIEDVEFILVGDGELGENIRLGASISGLTVTFVGRVAHEDVGCWMNLFDVMILPSRNEGWPCVVLEAFACGTPVVGSQNGGVAEAIGGLCPYVAECDGFETKFADAVCQVLIGEYPIDSELLITRAKEHIWESIVDREIEVYYSIYNKGFAPKLN